MENTDAKNHIMFVQIPYGRIKKQDQSGAGLVPDKHHHRVWMLRMKRDTRCSFSIWATLDLKYLKGGSVPPGFEEPWRYWQPIFLNFSNSETKSDWSALEAARAAVIW